MYEQIDMEMKTLEPYERATSSRASSSTLASPIEEPSERPSAFPSRSGSRHGSYNSSSPRYRLLLPKHTTSAPLVIFFHGSGDSCMTSWLPLAKATLESGYRCLLADRGSSHGADLKPHQAVSELLAYLHQHPDAKGPYVLVAHSYGGSIARLFLQQRPKDVAGIVLAETGQETALAPSVEREQYKKQILGHRPLAVIRANSLRRKWDEYQAAFELARTDEQRDQLEPQRQMLETWDRQDEMLKKRQLGLSRNSRYVYLPDCGHHVIREKPELVLKEVRWVMDQICGPGAVRPGTAASIKRSMSLRRNPSSAGGSGGAGGVPKLKRGLSQRLRDWARA
ncbi:alpha/beta-hydrolase [Polychaeton citri CBS 116435]|uniref:Alpha/beta-hydrolase n=1 Tax=Polychaeton citri CBS 116435 TaxID=1314669 RepID=A0A9P4Q066_9PEZI|nr:alpha/beta-hydrolase [Polychaeton citri CBS 116435]